MNIKSYIIIIDFKKINATYNLTSQSPINHILQIEPILKLKYEKLKEIGSHL